MNENIPDDDLPPTAGEAAQDVVDRLGTALKMARDPDEFQRKIAEARQAIHQQSEEERALVAEQLAERFGKTRKSGKKGKRSKKERPALDLMAGKLQKTAARVLDTMVLEGELPTDFLLRIMRSKNFKMPVRIQCAIAVAPYIHPRLAFIQSRKVRDPNDVTDILKQLEGERRRLNGRRGVNTLPSPPQIEQNPPLPSEQTASSSPPDPSASQSPPAGEGIEAVASAPHIPEKSPNS